MSVPGQPSGVGNFLITQTFFMRGIDSATGTYVYWLATTNDPTAAPVGPTTPPTVGSLSSVQQVLRQVQQTPITVGGIIYEHFTTSTPFMPGSGSSAPAGITGMGGWWYGAMMFQNFTTGSDNTNDTLVFSGSQVQVV